MARCHQGSSLIFGGTAIIYSRASKYLDNTNFGPYQTSDLSWWPKHSWATGHTAVRNGFRIATSIGKSMRVWSAEWAWWRSIPAIQSHWWWLQVPSRIIPWSVIWILLYLSWNKLFHTHPVPWYASNSPSRKKIHLHVQWKPGTW